MPVDCLHGGSAVSKVEGNWDIARFHQPLTRPGGVKGFMLVQVVPPPAWRDDQLFH